MERYEGGNEARYGGENVIHELKTDAVSYQHCPRGKSAVTANDINCFNAVLMRFRRRTFPLDAANAR